MLFLMLSHSVEVFFFLMGFEFHMVVFGFSCVQSVRSLSSLAGGFSFTGRQRDHNDSPFTKPVSQMNHQGFYTPALLTACQFLPTTQLSQTWRVKGNACFLRDTTSRSNSCGITMQLNTIRGKRYLPPSAYMTSQTPVIG